MADFPDKDIDETRAALAPTLDAMASILPWVGKAQPLRFSPELNKRWQEACKELAERWQARAKEGPTAIRPAIFALLSIAIESGELDYLELCESLASVADHLEQGAPGARLTAALISTTEALLDEGGLENPKLPARARHFSQRLNDALQPSAKPGERSDVLDRLFVEDADERVAHMREALDVLPLDVVALEQESAALIHQAEQIEMWGIYHLARQLHNFAVQLSDVSEAVQDQAARDLAQQLDLIDQALRAVDI